MAMPIEQLDELLEEKLDVVGDDSFRITDMQLAVWADEKARDAEMKLKEIDALADDRIEVLQAKIDKLNEWREEAKKPYQNNLEFFKFHLILFLSNHINDQIKKSIKKIERSIKLPFRTLQSRTQQPEIVKDDEKLIVWAEICAPEYVEQKPSLKWGELKGTLTLTEVDGKPMYVDRNGEVVPHIQLIPRADVLDWKVKE